MKKADRIFGVIGLGLALWSYLESTRLQYMTEFTPGPGFFPFWVGVVLALLSLYLIVSTYTRKPSEKDNKKVLPEKHMLYRVGFIMLLLVSEGFGFSALEQAAALVDTSLRFRTSPARATAAYRYHLCKILLREYTAVAWQRTYEVDL